MIENHNFSKKSRELSQKAKSGNDKAKTELMIHELEAIQTYSTDFNSLFPAMSNVEFVYALVGAKKCVENMLKTLFEHNPILKIHVNILDATFDEAVETESVMTDATKLAEMMKGTGNDG